MYITSTLYMINVMLTSVSSVRNNCHMKEEGGEFICCFKCLKRNGLSLTANINFKEQFQEVLIYVI